MPNPLSPRLLAHVAHHPSHERMKFSQTHETLRRMMMSKEARKTDRNKDVRLAERRLANRYVAAAAAHARKVDENLLSEEDVRIAYGDLRELANTLDSDSTPTLRQLHLHVSTYISFESPLTTDFCLLDTAYEPS